MCESNKICVIHTVEMRYCYVGGSICIVEYVIFIIIPSAIYTAISE